VASWSVAVAARPEKMWRSFIGAVHHGEPCNNDDGRRINMRALRIVAATVLCAFFLDATPVASQQSAGAEVLTNETLIKLVKAGLTARGESRGSGQQKHKTFLV